MLILWVLYHITLSLTLLYSDVDAAGCIIVMESEPQRPSTSELYLRMRQLVNCT